MAIVINSNPGDYYSANGDLIFVVYEATKANDPVTYPDYKYVADIYVGLTLVARLKKVPHPDNKRGVFNIGDIVRNYIALAFNPESTVFVSQELGLTEFFIDVTVKFGEEYGFTLYTNLLIDSERRYYNHYNGRMLGMNTALTPYLDKVASTRPYATPVNANDNFTLIPYLPSTNDSFDVIITKYGPLLPSTNVVIEWGYFSSDPYATIGSESFQFSALYISGSNTLALNFTSAGDEKYLVLKEPINQPVKTTWMNTIFNYGTIPDSVFRAATVISGFRYYVSRIPVVLDSTNFSIIFGNASPDPVSQVVTASFTEVVTPHGTTLGPDSILRLTEQTSLIFINGDGQLKINGTTFQDITASGDITVNMPVGSPYSFEAFNNTATAAATPKIRLTITKGITVIFDSQISATPNASIVKTGIVQNEPYLFSINTLSTTTPVTPIDIPDNNPVPFTSPLQILNVSPGEINILMPGFIDDTVEYYTVQFGDLSLYRFNLVCESRFEVFRLHFLNKFGGFETRDFTKVSRKVLTITKSEFGKLPYTIDSAGNVNYYNSNNVYNEQQSVYASQYTEKITLNSDILTDQEYVWLSELILSPLIYVEQSGYFLPCSIIQSNYTFNKVINDKLTNLTIDINFGDQFNTQYR